MLPIYYGFHSLPGYQGFQHRPSVVMQQVDLILPTHTRTHFSVNGSTTHWRMWFVWNLPTTCLLSCKVVSYICDSGFSCYVILLVTQVIAIKCFKFPSRHDALIVYLLQALVVVIRYQIPKYQVWWTFTYLSPQKHHRNSFVHFSFLKNDLYHTWIDRNMSTDEKNPMCN